MENKNLTKTAILGELKVLRTALERIISVTEPKTQKTIYVKKDINGTHLYGRVNSEKPKYLGLSNAKEISSLSQSRYNSEICKAARREIQQIDEAIKALEDEKHGTADIDEVYSKFPEILKPYITPHPLSSEEYARKWQEGNVVVKRKRIHEEDDYHRFKTIRGDYVGSKSEVMIADRLMANDIPYHYEVAFIPEIEVDARRPIYDEFGTIIGYEAPGFDPFSRDTLHPDFYVLNKRTRKAYFWEHLGKLQDPKYCHVNLNRLIRMLDAGYTIGEDVLVTHEDANHPLRTESIDDIIEKYLK